MAVGNFLNRLKFWKRNVDEELFKVDDCTPEYLLARRLKQYEKYVSQIQGIVMWDNPTLTVMCILFVNMLFWVFVSLEWRFYGIVSSLLLAVSVHEAWTLHVWPEISVVPYSSSQSTQVTRTTHPSVVAVSRAVTSSWAAVKQCLLWLRNLRARQPGLFCCVSSVLCSALLLLGRTVSGLLLVYALLMTLLLGPGVFHHCVPPHLKQTVSQYISCFNEAFTKYSSEVSDDEYLPVTTSEDLALLTRASDLQHDTYDSLTNPGSSSDMASGLEIPSHEDDSLSDVDQQTLDQPDASQQIEFQSGHFNGDSSSDEEAFTRDLVITEADEKDNTSQGLSTLIAKAVTSNVLGSVGLLANVVRQRRPTRRTDSDSDNDDFEIINRDELKDS